MADERPHRPQSRDRFGGDRPAPRSFGDRPPPRGGDRFGGDRPGGDRPAPRPGGFTPRPSGPPRPSFTPRPAFNGPPSSSPQAAPPTDGSASVRLRDGDREVEVHGPAAFCRQLLEDLPALMGRLRGEGRTSAASISLPPPPPAPPVAARLRPEPIVVDAVVDDEPADLALDEELVDAVAELDVEIGAMASAPPPARRRGPGRPPKTGRATRPEAAAAAPASRRKSAAAPAPTRKPAAAPAQNGATAIEGLIIGALRSAGGPIGIADIRRQLPENVSGQAVRRILERATAVVNVGGKPATYRIR